MPRSRSTDAGGPGKGHDRRRKSTGFFSRASISGLTPIHDDSSANALLKKKRRPTSFFQSSGINGEADVPREEDEHEDSPKFRPRTLLKAGRPSSILGSFRSKRSTDEDEQLTSPTSKSSSIEDGDQAAASVPAGGVVLNHGEVSATGGMFRRRKEYLVLTDRHLIRFKSQARAAEAFPCLPMLVEGNSSMRHTSMSSAGSASDLYSHSSADGQSGVPLQHILAVFRIEDGKPFFSIEVAHLDEETGQATSMNIQLTDPREADGWLSDIRAAATRARSQHPAPFPQRSVEYVARSLEQERDYDPSHFRIFKVVQRASNKSASRASSDDLSKLSSTICYLVVGIHKIHLVPLHRSLSRSSATSLSDLDSHKSFGILTVISINVRTVDDAMEVLVRLPLQPQQSIYLASGASVEIALAIRHAAEYLRPQWLEQPFVFKVPKGVEDVLLPVNPAEEDHGCFDRTLTAHCASFNLDTSNLRYAIDYEVEDAPQFRLLPPASRRRRARYNALELLAVLRTLRWNESFHSISLAGISLDPLHRLHDDNGIDQIAWTSRSGVAHNIRGLGQKSLLIQELQGIALKNKKLRRMDFSFCINRKPQEDESGPADPGCEIAEAIFPLCRRQLTNVDWIVLNGIELSETDLDYLVDAAVERSCHLRALEISRCGLTDRSLQLILNSMLSQDSTLESIDISGNLARLSPSTFQGQIGHFGFIRKLNLSRVQRTSGPEPLVAPETMLAWRLEELHLSETNLNEQTVDSIAAYLASSMSDTLRELRLNQCGLTGKDVAVFMRSMSRGAGIARNLHLHVSENRLEKDHDALVAAMSKGYSPSHLTMRMVEYQKEDHFRELLLAIKQNNTLRYLDISKASLPYDANHDTCEALQQMFMENETLEELDISGEHAHLEVAKFGIGLNHALTGLKTNCALKVLRIEYQKLGLQGANTLGSVLSENKALREIYCEHNEINLQAMTALVDGLVPNKTVLYLPRLDPDRIASLQNLEKEIQASRTEPPVNLKQHPVRRTLATVKSAKMAPSPTAPSYTDQDIREALRIMNEKWDRQVARLEQCLQRNHDIAHGVTVEPEDGEVDRPTTGTSFSGMLERARADTTPTVERGDVLAGSVQEKLVLDTPPASAPSSPPRKGGGSKHRKELQV